MRLNKWIFIGLLIVLFFALISSRYYYKKLQLTKQELQTLDLKCGYVHRIELCFELFAEVLIKKGVSRDEVQELFTFKGKNLLDLTDSTDFFWRALDYNGIDKVFKDYDTLYYVKELHLYLLFKDSALVDYRHWHADRKFLNEYFECGGEFPLTN
jgi:hypothetical protein